MVKAMFCSHMNIVRNKSFGVWWGVMVSGLGFD